MRDRKKILMELDLIAQQLRDLEIHFEKYFSGQEKRAPLKKREALERKLRRAANRQVIQTDLRYRYESLSARFFSYCTHWDRTLRLMDEGRSVRQRPRNDRPSATTDQPSLQEENEQVYQQWLKARKECALDDAPPDKEKFSAFLARQRAALKDKFEGRQIEFRVVCENGKPKIKAKAKNSD